MNKPSALLFDLDGTLLDTARDLGNALNYVLAKYDFPLCSYEQYRPIASDGSLGLLNLGFGDQLGKFDFDVLRQQFLDYYNDNICIDTVPFEGVIPLIAELDRKDLPWGIVTNKPGWLTDVLLPNFDAFANCKIAISGDTLAQRKPHPEPLLHAAKALGIDPLDTWYVGDAERDIEAANAANMISVVADYGYISDNQTSKRWQADLHIDSPTDLLKFL